MKVKFERIQPAPPPPQDKITVEFTPDELAAVYLAVHKARNLTLGAECDEYTSLLSSFIQNTYSALSYELGYHAGPSVDIAKKFGVEI